MPAARIGSFALISGSPVSGGLFIKRRMKKRPAANATK
jgi:hypothetical protein